jgi:hypothetical protein
MAPGPWRRGGKPGPGRARDICAHRMDLQLPLRTADLGERDWCDYVDWLATRGINLFQIWAPVGMMAVPLGPDDSAWLAMIGRVITYAQQLRGLRVWVGEAANNVVSDVTGIAFKDREYFRFCVGQMLDPSDSAAMAREGPVVIADLGDGTAAGGLRTYPNCWPNCSSERRPSPAWYPSSTPTRWQDAGRQASAVWSTWPSERNIRFFGVLAWLSAEGWPACSTVPTCSKGRTFGAGRSTPEERPYSRSAKCQ